MTTHLPKEVFKFLQSKPPKAAELFLHFYGFYTSLTGSEVEVTKTTIAFGKYGRQCYIYQFGKNFIGGVLRLPELFDEPAIFFKARAVSSKTFAHHFKIYEKDDLSIEFKKYLKLAMVR